MQGFSYLRHSGSPSNLENMNPAETGAGIKREDGAENTVKRNTQAGKKGNKDWRSGLGGHLWRSGKT
jgi:hypothetical protein